MACFFLYSFRMSGLESQSAAEVKRVSSIDGSDNRSAENTADCLEADQNKIQEGSSVEVETFEPS